MREAVAETQGTPIDVEKEATLENIMVSLRGLWIHKQSASFTAFASATASSAKVSSSSPPSTLGIHSYFVPMDTPGAQPSLEGTIWNKEVHEKTNI